MWVFKVPHFTRYTFAISDSEEEPERDQGEQDRIQISDYPIELSVDPELESIGSKKRPREDFHSEPGNTELEIKPLRLGPGFRIGISPQGKIFVPSVTGELVAYLLNFDNTEAELGLKLQMETLPPVENRAERMRYPIASLENYWYRLAQRYSGMESAGQTVEAILWSIFCVLFGDPHINISEILEVPMAIENSHLSPAQMQLKRKKALYSWLVAWGEPSPTTHDVGTSVLNMILSGNLKEGVKFACEAEYPILASLLSMTSTEFSKELIRRQIEEWKTQKVFNTFPPSIQNLYRLLAGDVDAIEGVTWKHKLILLMLYGFPKYEWIPLIFGELDANFGKIRPESLGNPNFIDVCYNLLRVFSNPGTLNAEVFHPYTFQAHFSLGTSWLLHFSLNNLYAESPDHEEFNTSEIANVFADLGFLSAAFAEELVNNNRPDLAVYVLTFCPSSENLIKDILFRNAHLGLETSFFVEYLGLPQEWIEEAQALFDKNQFQFHSSFSRYIECMEYYKAYELFMGEIGPDFIIKYSGHELYDRLYSGVLAKIEPYSHQIAAWVLSGEIYIEYLTIAVLFEKWRRPERLDDLYSLIRRVDALFGPVLGLPKAVLKQKVAVGIMQSSLNAWKLQILEAKASHNLLSCYETLENTHMCQKEDLLRFSESLIYRFLKSSSQGMVS